MRKLLILSTLVCLLLGFGAVSIAPIAIQAQDDPAPTWDGESRFTVLILGMDRRPGARDTLRVRTDVNILISIDPTTQSVGMLHIPRDFHLTPAGSGDFIRVNTLLLEGEDIAESFGPYYAMETIQYNFGMYVDRYVAFDFEAFITIIDALGGIEITVEYPIYDPTYPDMNYGIDPLVLEPGTYTFDGETALAFARTRHGDNDFQRGLRQLQVIEAVYERLQDDGVLLSLIPQAQSLFGEIQRNIYTDLAIPDIIQLAQFATSIPRENIASNTLGDEGYYITYATADGRSVYIPDRASIADLLTNTFGENYYGQ